jgi:two-component SAPR family response regulator
MLFENNQSYCFDMIVLDIQMGKMNGIELAKKIREIDNNVIIAFISGMADFVFEGYEV